ncbi:MAG: glycosyltransferase [Rhizobacter sp.]|nr:glycosyltransferase [Rhizobacter sp.]
MTTPPLVSVVVPAYNQSAYLSEALRSALAQTHRNLDIIVVDDGSTDDTRAVCEAFRDSRLRYLYQPNDGTRGLGARNQGLLQAHGDWIALLDQDDRWVPEKIERQLQRVAELQAKGLSIGAAFCAVRFIDEHGAVIRIQEASELPEGAVFHDLLLRNRYFVSSGMFSRNLLGVAGLPNESAGLADWALWLGIARHAPVAIVREHLADYREHSQGYQAQLLARNRLRFAEDQWRTVHGQAMRLHPNCRECRAIHRRGVHAAASLYLRAARRALTMRQWGDVWPAVRGGLMVAPAWLLRPWVLVLETFRLAGSLLRGLLVRPR